VLDERKCPFVAAALQDGGAVAELPLRGPGCLFEAQARRHQVLDRFIGMLARFLRAYTLRGAAAPKGWLVDASRLCAKDERRNDFPVAVNKNVVG
jgi:hypothetical protein